MRSFILATIATIATLATLAIASPTGDPAVYRAIIGNGEASLYVAKRDLEKRTVTPDGSCGGLFGYTCGPPWGMCCGIDNWCGLDVNYCAGGCQPAWGVCYPPHLQLAFDANAGDAIWDPISNNVFDAEVGDGVIYYGARPTVSGGWPT